MRGREISSTKVTNRISIRSDAPIGTGEDRNTKTAYMLVERYGKQRTSSSRF